MITKEEGEFLAGYVESRMRRRRYERGHWDSIISGYREVELPIPSDLTLFNGGSGIVPSPLSEESSSASAIVERIRSAIERYHFGPNGAVDEEGAYKPPPVSWLPCHGVDLREGGRLGPHVDSVRYSGSVVAGLSLLSPCVMRLRPAPASEIASAGGGQDDGGITRRMATTAATETGATEEGGCDDEADGYVDLHLLPLSLYVLSGPSRYAYTHEILPSGSAFCGGGGDMTVTVGRRISVILRDARVGEERK